LEIFKKILELKAQNLPFVAYKNPNKKELFFLAQDTDSLNVFTDFNTVGFVFAPFDNDKPAYILKADKVLSETITDYSFKVSKTNHLVNERSKIFHKELVKKAILNMESGNTTKIVISRKEELELLDFDLINVFQKMLSLYVNAYVYVWFHPKVGLWLGATPETLLKVEGNNFETMSLAGTQAYKKQKKITWGDKELVEQQMVSDFIKQNLQDKVKTLSFANTETVKAGNLLHLRTKISGALFDKKDIKTLVKLLHPTPAVCGLPKENSKVFILKNENYDRSFYTGYLGEVNIKNQTNLYVNLRCFSVSNNIVSIYVGGGITKDSCPDLEFKETVAKSLTIKNVLA